MWEWIKDRWFYEHFHMSFPIATFAMKKSDLEIWRSNNCYMYSCQENEETSM